MSRFSTPIKALAFACLLSGIFSLSACSTLGYYTHLAHGEIALLSARHPIARVAADPATDETLRQHLLLAIRAREFASDQLQLPRNSSYTTYADLGRSFAMWNVFAAPEFSLDPRRHCFPIAGCVSYRGYYDRAHAQAEATRLHAQGLDTWVGGVSAYSTLGWFSDPVLNTMLRQGDDVLAATIFHELAHQRLYVKGDTEFNESFASFVEREGLRQWRESRGLAAEDGRQRHDGQFTRLLLATRDRLQKLYASAGPTDVLRARKQEEIERLRTDYAQLRHEQWNDDDGYDGWINSEINNAKLLPIGLYDRWVPAFAVLFARSGRDWRVFHARVQVIARMRKSERDSALEQLR